MSETGQAGDFGRVVKILYRYALDPAGWIELIDSLREIAPAEGGDEIIAALEDHLEMASELAVGTAPEPPETFASIKLSPDLEVLHLSATAADEFAPVFGALAVGAQIDGDGSDAAAALEGGIAQLQTAPHEKIPIVIPHGAKLSCSYLVRAQGPGETYALYLMRNGFAEAYDLSGSLLKELTDKEREISNLLYEGLSPQQIAEASGTSLNTVRFHLKSIFGKTGINKQADLIRVLEQAYQLERELDRQLGQQSRLVIDLGRGATLEDGPHPEKQFIARPGGRRMAWRDYGPEDGRPVIWVPGAYAGARLWKDAVAAARENHLRLIGIDRPGYGGTSKLTPPSVEGVGADVAAMMDALGLEEVDVFAPGMGGLYALHLAHAEPARIARVFLCSTSFGPNSEWKRPSNRMQFSLWLARRSPRLVHAYFKLFIRPRTKEGQMHQIRSMWSDSKHDVEALRDDRLTEYLVAVAEEALADGLDGVVSDMLALMEARVPLGEIRQPVTEWHGMDDPLVTWDEAGTLLAALPNLDRIPVPHRGQLLFHTDFRHMAERMAAR